MKRALFFALLLTVGFALAASAQTAPGSGVPGAGQGANWVDANGNGICDLFEAGGQSGQGGQAKRNGQGKGMGPNQGQGLAQGQGKGVGGPRDGFGPGSANCTGTGTGQQARRRSR